MQELAEYHLTRRWAKLHILCVLLHRFRCSSITVHSIDWLSSTLCITYNSSEVICWNKMFRMRPSPCLKMMKLLSSVWLSNYLRNGANHKLYLLILSEISLNFTFTSFLTKALGKKWEKGITLFKVKYL